MRRFLARAVRRSSESFAIARFGADLGEQFRIVSTLLLRNNKNAFPVTFRFKRNGIVFLLTLTSHGDLMLFHEIFCGDPYWIDLAGTPTYIIDLGANIGVSTLYLHTSFPNAKIAAVEANPSLTKRLTDAVGAIKEITILPYAASAKDEVRTFYVSKETPLGSSLIDRGTGYEGNQVKACSLETLRAEAGYPTVDLVKFDIEGAEWDVFSSYPKCDTLKGIVGEVHEDLMGAPLDAFKNLFKGMALRLIPTKKKGRYIIYGSRA